MYLIFFVGWKDMFTGRQTGKTVGSFNTTVAMFSLKQFCQSCFLCHFHFLLFRIKYSLKDDAKQAQTIIHKRCDDIETTLFLI